MNCLKALPVKHGLSRLSCPPLLTPTVLVGSLIAPHPSISVNFSPNDSRWSKDHFVSVFLHDNTILEQKWCVVWIYLFCQGNSSEDHSWSDKFQLVLQVARKVQVGIPPFYSYHHHHHHHHRHYHFAYSLCLLLFFVCFFFIVLTIKCAYVCTLQETSPLSRYTYQTVVWTAAHNCAIWLTHVICFLEHPWKNGRFSRKIEEVRRRSLSFVCCFVSECNIC